MLQESLPLVLGLESKFNKTKGKNKHPPEIKSRLYTQIGEKLKFILLWAMAPQTHKLTYKIRLGIIYNAGYLRKIFNRDLESILLCLGPLQKAESS